MTESKGKHAILVRTSSSELDVITLIQVIVEEKISRIGSFSVVESGSDTFEFLEDKQIDLVIVDGLKSGQLEVVRLISKSYPKTIILVILGWSATKDDMRSALNAGAIDFIDRPLSPIIVETIETALDRGEPSQY